MAFLKENPFLIFYLGVDNFLVSVVEQTQEQFRFGLALPGKPNVALRKALVDFRR